MIKTVYHIVSHRKKWYVKLNNEIIIEELSNKSEAIKFAFNEMKKNIQSGKNAQIFVHERNCEWKVKCNFNVSDIFPFNRIYFNGMRTA